MSSDEARPVAHIRCGPTLSIPEHPAAKFAPPRDTGDRNRSWISNQCAAWVIYRNECLVERARRESVDQWLKKRKRWQIYDNERSIAEAVAQAAPTLEWENMIYGSPRTIDVRARVPIYCTLPVVGSREEWRAAIDDHRIFANEDGLFDQEKVRKLFPPPKQAAAIGAAPASLRPATADEIRKALTAVYYGAPDRPPNIRQVVKPVQGKLAAQGLAASGRQIQEIADEQQFKVCRGQPGVNFRYRNRRQ
jgi:hypothetical protein